MARLNQNDEPKRVYIQNWGSGEATWCTDRINGPDDMGDCPDLEYVHIDIVTRLLDACEYSLKTFNHPIPRIGMYLGEETAKTLLKAAIAKVTGEQ